MTIFKAALQVADMGRNHYRDHALTIARHPSETDERMMVRLLAFALHAHERLSFGQGLGSDDEPDLWQKDLTGAIEEDLVGEGVITREEAITRIDPRQLRTVDHRATRKPSQAVLGRRIADAVASTSAATPPRQICSMCCTPATSSAARAPTRS